MDFESTFYGRPNTIRTYKSLFKKHVEPLSLEVDLTSWAEEDTIKALMKWDQGKLSRNTKITLIRLLGRYIKFTGGPEIDSQKFIKSLQRSEQQKEVTSLSSGESKRLMSVTKRLEPKLYPVLLLGLHAGLRRGEVFGLRCSDVDMLNGRIKVAHSYDGPTKNGKSRSVPMSKEISAVLTKMLHRASGEKIFERFDPNPALKRACQKAKISTKMTFHTLRHTFATLALTNGVNPRQVQEWLGHSSVVTTMSIYWNLINNQEAALDFLPG